MNNGPVNWQFPINWAHPLNRGLVAWWLVVPHWTGGLVWRDLTRLYDGTLITMDPATDWVVSERPGGWGALDFDGGNDHVLISAAVISGRPLSFISWFNAANATSAMTLVAVADTSESNMYYRLIARGDAVGDPLRMDSRSAGGIRFCDSTTGYTAGTWHQGAGAIDAAGNMVAYIDGGSKGTNNAAKIPTGLDNTSIAQVTRSGSSESTTGLIDDVRIYDRVLAPGEIAELYQLSQQFYPGLLNRVRRVFKAPAAVGFVPYPRPRGLRAGMGELVGGMH